MFLSCRPFVVIKTFSTGLVGAWLGQLTVEDINIHILDGTTVENKGKTIN